MIRSSDLTDRLQETVILAIKTKTPINIIGGNSKAFYGREPAGQPVYLKEHCGIINYHPTELVVTARTGTLLSDLQEALAEHGQMLAFEPPAFADAATLGGTIACGFSGPRRPFSGSARDFVLGCKIVNGKGQVLSFGGEVMKNVAGYDVSRLMVGAMGTLGVLLEVSLKVLPIPDVEITCCFELAANAAIDRMTTLAGQCLPVSGLSYDGSMLYVRLSGAEKAVKVAAENIGGDTGKAGNQYWQRLNEHRLDFFRTDGNLWRICLPPATGSLELDGEWHDDWGGGLRWLKSEETADRIFSAAEQALGHAVLFSGKDRSGEIFQPLTGKLKQLNHNIKRAFDPNSLLNPNRMYRDW